MLNNDNNTSSHNDNEQKCLKKQSFKKLLTTLKNQGVNITVVKKPSLFY